MRVPVLVAALLGLGLAACIPVVPGLRQIHGQRWTSRFDVNVQVAGSSLRLPVDLAIDFEQSFQHVTAEATLQYDAGIFRLQTGGLVELSGQLGFDDSLTLDSQSGALSFDGRFVGDSLVGTVAIVGVVPVADVVFYRVR